MDYRAALSKAPGSAPSEHPQGSPKPQPKKAPKNPPKEKVVEQVPALADTSDESVDHSKVIAPVVRFELYVPQAEKDNEDDDEEALKAEAEEGEDVVATPGDASDAQKEKASPKLSGGDSSSRYFPVQVVAGRRNRASELASFLLKNIDSKNVDIQGGFRFFEKVNQKNSNNFTVKPIAELNLDTVPQALRWVQAVIDILNNKQPPQIACGHNSFIHLARIGETLKVTRSYNDDGRRVEFLFKLEDFALKVREQAKGYVKAAQAVEEAASRRERDNKTKSTKLYEKVNSAGFNSAAKDLKKLFGTTTALPKLSQKFQKQQQKKTQSKKQLQTEYKAMKALVLELVPKSFLERDIATLVPKEDEEPEVPEIKEEKPAPAPQGAKKTGDKKGQQAAAQPAKPEKGAEKKDQPAAEKKPRFDNKEKDDRALKFSSNPYDIGEWEVNIDKGTVATTTTAAGKPAAQPKQQQQPTKADKKKQPQQQPAKKEEKKPVAKKEEKKKPEQPKPQQKKADKPKQTEKAASKSVAKAQPKAGSSSNYVIFAGVGVLALLIYVFYMFYLPKLQGTTV